MEDSIAREVEFMAPVRGRTGLTNVYIGRGPGRPAATEVTQLRPASEC